MLRALQLLSDERLAQLTARGSDPAFATLYGRYESTLFAYCRSITRNADDGWDAFQNAMVKALVAMKRTERDAPVRPWLFRIAHNEAIALLRRRCVAQKADLGRGDLTAAGADEEAAMRESVNEVVGDVRELPTGPRAALVMRELADLEYGDIALALGTTEGNARQLVFAARSGLRDSRDGRGLACEQVRHQLAFADGRLLRRRTVRAHLRSCDACREYAASVPRKTAVRAWFPLAAALESVLGGRAAAGGAPLMGKAAAVAAMAATSVGAIDLSSLRPEPAHVSAGVRAAAAPRATAKERRAHVRTVAAVATVARAKPATRTVSLPAPTSVRRRTATQPAARPAAPRRAPERRTAREPAPVPRHDSDPAPDAQPTRDGAGGGDCPPEQSPDTQARAEAPGGTGPAYWNR